MPERNQRGHHHRNRYLAVLAHARTHRRDDQRFDGFGPAHGLRLLARHRSQQRWFPLRVSRRDERHRNRDRPHRQNLFQLARSTGDAWIRRRSGARISGRRLYRMAARPRVRRLDSQSQCGCAKSRDRRGRGCAQRHRLVGCHVHPRHPLAGRTARAGRLWRVRLSQPEPVQGVGNLARPRRARVDRGADRDADAARHAAVPAGARPRHPAEPQPGRRHQHDHGSVFADARRILRCSARWPTISPFRRAIRAAFRCRNWSPPARSSRWPRLRAPRRTAFSTRSAPSPPARRPISSCSTPAPSTPGR